MDEIRNRTIPRTTWFDRESVVDEKLMTRRHDILSRRDRPRKTLRARDYVSVAGGHVMRRWSAVTHMSPCTS